MKSLLHILRHRSEQTPNQPVFTFLEDGENPSAQLTMASLESKSQELALRLLQLASPGDRIMLLLPQGIDFIVVFYACLKAGLIAVPCSIPSKRERLKRTRSIADNAQPRIALCDATFLGRSIAKELINDYADCQWLSMDQIPEAADNTTSLPAYEENDAAYLQYSSGSTGNPKGNIISQGNIVHNLACFQAQFEHDENTVCISWLPFFHDMGLVYGLLQPVYSGYHCYLMAPLTFVRNPILWLRAMSKFGGTHSVAPNFAFELCATIPTALREGLDLSKWKVAINGSEFIRANTLENFTETYTPYGWRHEVFCPGYGLAEATLMVTAQSFRHQPRITQNIAPTFKTHFNSAELNKRIVGCGQLNEFTEVQIVNPDTKQRLAEGEVGEIWLAGKCIALGYWNNEEATQATFRGRIDGEEKNYLRTGDLGFVVDNELYIVGRIKELLILNGQNFYPTDLEMLAESCHPALQENGTCAFSYSIEGQEKVALVCEIKRTAIRELASEEVVKNIRAHMIEEYGVRISSISFIKPRALPRTTSGKIKRVACRLQFLAEELSPFYTWQAESLALEETTPTTSTNNLPLAEVRQSIIDAVAQLCAIAPEHIALDEALSYYGLDSNLATRLAFHLSERWNRAISPTHFYDYPTIEALSQMISATAPDTSGENPAMETPAPQESIAIIGMAGRFPGAANLEAFWKLLEKGETAIGKLPENRWQQAGRQSDTEYPGAQHAGLLENIDQFDPYCFGITPREAISMDPQQRLLLELTIEALQHAGIRPSEIKGSKTGVYIGISSNDYARFSVDESASAHAITGIALSIAASRIAYWLDLKGPAFAIDTACSSSLVAIQRAVIDLQNGTIDQAIVGGVNLLLDPAISLVFDKAGMLSPDGRCKTFDASANGYVRSEGGGLIVLKKASQAEADHDPIQALICGVAVNQDGKSNGITAPNGRSQMAVVKEALQAAQLNPQDINFIETHGTGTPLGDPIEVNALKAVLSNTNATTSACWLTAVKANIGHLEAAAGVAGLIKTVLCLQHQRIPAQAGFNELNPQINLQDADRLKIANQAVDLSMHQQIRAGISSFGFGGTNAHVILESYPQPTPAPTEEQPDQALLLLSARTPAALETLVERYLDRKEELEKASLTALSYSSIQGRDSMNFTLGLVGSNHRDWWNSLAEYPKMNPAQSFLVEATAQRNPKVVWVFTGQGSQYPGMAKTLYETETLFRTIIDECHDLLMAEEINLHELLLDNTKEEIHQTEYAQPAIFCLEYALARLLIDWGFKPDALLGHSIGEYVAACLAGVFTLREALAMIALRGRLMQSMQGGGMAAVFLEEKEVINYLHPHRGKLDIAAYNSRDRIVVSGEAAALEVLYDTFRAEKIPFKALKVSRAFHSPMTEDLLPTFAEALTKVDFKAPQIPIISTLTGQHITTEMNEAGYWVRHIRESVRFYNATQIAGENHHFFIEIGPKSQLRSTLEQNLTDHQVLYALSGKNDNRSDLLSLAGQLQAHGFDPYWEQIAFGPTPPAKVALPLMPYDKQSYWIKEIKKPSITAPPSIETPSSMATLNASTSTSQLVDLVSQVLHITADQLDPKASLASIGADSILLLELLKKIKNQFSVTLTIRQLFGELSSIEAIANYIAANAPAPVVEAKATPTIATSNGNGQVKTTAVAAAKTTPLTPPATLPSANHSNELTGFFEQQLHLINNTFQQQFQLLGQSTPTNLPATNGTLNGHQNGRLNGQVNGHANGHLNGHSNGHANGKHLSFAPAQPTTTGSTQVDPANSTTNNKLTEERTLTPSQQAFFNNLLERYQQKTAQSQAHAATARQHHADWLYSIDFRLFTKEFLYPIVLDEATGTRLTDIDGNEYLDIGSGYGVNYFGNKPEFIRTAMLEQWQKGEEIATQNRLAAEVAKAVCELTGQERVTYTNSGTEAVMAAMRIARSVTRKDKVVLFQGFYHGTFDGSLVQLDIDSDQMIARSTGIPQGMVQDIILLNYGQDSALEIIEREKDQIAAVLIEPIQSRKPEGYYPEFLRALREVTSRSNVALIFDEIITGFRVHPGGMQALAGVKADLVTYGKVIGGGMPIGIIAGQNSYMDAIDGGHWQHGDQSHPEVQKIFFGGTFCKHPLTMAAAKAVALKLLNEGPQLQENVNAKAARLEEELNHFFQSLEVPMKVVRFASLFRFKTFGDYSMLLRPIELDLFFYALMEKGIFTWERRICFLSTEHTDADIDQVIAMVKETIWEMLEAGFFPKAKRDVPPPALKEVQLSPVQQELLQLSNINNGASTACQMTMALKVKGHLRVDVLKQALKVLSRRHDALRMWIDANNQSIQIGEEVAITLRRQVILDIEPKKFVLQYLYDAAAEAIDIHRGPLFQLHLLEGEEVSYLVFVLHHLVGDGWSMGVLVKDLTEIYNQLLQGGKLNLSEAPQFSHYLQRVNRSSYQHSIKASKNYWLDLLQDRIPTAMPFAMPQARSSSFAGRRVQRKLSKATYGPLVELAKEQGCTMFMSLYAAFSFVLHKLNEDRNLLIGIPTANRQEAEDFHMIGSCADLIPISSTWNSNWTFLEYLAEIKSALADSYAHQDCTWANLQNEVSLKQSQQLRVLFNLDNNIDVPKLGAANLSLFPTPLRFSQFDFFFDLALVGEDLIVNCDFRRVLFEVPAVEHFLDLFENALVHLVEGAAKSLDQVPLLNEQQFAQLYVLGKGANRDVAWHMEVQEALRFAEAELCIVNRAGKAQVIGLPGKVALVVDKAPENAEDKNFVDHPFLANKRLWLSDIIARWSFDGKLILLGDQQEVWEDDGQFLPLYEVRHCLEQHPQISAAKIMHTANDWYVRIDADDNLSLVQVKQYLLKNLAGYLIPRIEFRGVERIEETPVSQQKQNTNTVTILSKIWEEVLELPEVDVNESFFDIGGQSLKGMQIAHRIKEQLGQKISLEEIIEYPTIQMMADWIDREPETTPTAHPVSFAQQRLWTLMHIEKQQHQYNMLGAFWLRGSLSETALAKSFAALVERHEILRTTIQMVDGELQQIVHPMPANFTPWTEYDWTMTNQGEEYLQSLLEDEANFHFDLANGALFRVSLVRLSEEEQVLCFNLHHILADAWSLDVIFDELSTFYLSFMEGRENTLPALSRQYKDLGLIQQKLVDTPIFTQQRDYWVEQFSGEVTRVNLPIDVPSRSLEKSYDGALASRVLSPTLSKAVYQVAKEERLTPFMILLAGVAALLNRYSPADEVILGTSVLGRGEKSLERQVGFYINMLALKIESGEAITFTDLLQNSKKTLLSALSNQDFPFDLLVEELALERSLSHTPLFDVYVSINDQREARLELHGLEVQNHQVPHTSSKYDLSFNFIEEEGNIRLEIEYATDLFSAQRIEMVLQHFDSLLTQCLTSPKAAIDQHQYLSAGEEQQLLGAFHGPRRELPESVNLVELFQTTAARHPRRIAIVDQEVRMSFKRLDQLSNQLARCLQSEGEIKRGDRVMLRCQSGYQMIIGILAILKAGGTYVPIDPKYPLDRIQNIRSICNPKLLLTDELKSTGLEDIPSIALPSIHKPSALKAYSKEALPLVGEEQDAVYTIFTSGSTGTPKGVVINHRNVYNTILWMWEGLGFEQSDVVLQKTNFTFDVSVWELFLPLCFGIRMVCCPKELSYDMEGLDNYIREQKVTSLSFVPGALVVYQDYLQRHENAAKSPIRRIISAGEALQANTVQTHYELFETPLFNLYGPTEATIYVSTYEAKPEDEVVPIGRPIANTELLVLDDNYRLCPVGVQGQIAIGGTGLSKGYYQKPELTAKAFIDHPYRAGEKLYLSGDVGKMTPQGELLFLGRKDHQVKLRGFRIELGEIETALGEHPQVAEAVVLMKGDANPFLVGYVLAQGPVSVKELRQYLQGKLPVYMVPAVLVIMDQFPRNSSNKIDRRALAKLEQKPRVVTEKKEVVAQPSLSDTETQVRQIWQEVLAKDAIDPNQNFFEAGGQSLKAIQIGLRLEAKFGQSVSFRDILEYPTIRSLAAWLDRATPDANPAPADQQVITGPFLASAAQKRLWAQLQIEETQHAYNLFGGYRIKGALDREALEKSFQALVERHQILRTNLVLEEGELIQQIRDFDPQQTIIRHHDLSADKEVEKKSAEILRQESQRTLDVAQDELLQIGLITLTKDEFILYLNWHHIISDAWSIEIFVNELEQLYGAFRQGQRNPLSTLTKQHVDYSHWQKSQWQSTTFKEHRNYWLQKLKGNLSPIELPLDVAQRPTEKAYRGGKMTHQLESSISTRVYQLSEAWEITPFMLLSSAVATLLHRYAGQEQVILGTSVSGRQHRDFAGQLGFYTNLLPLIYAITDDLSFRDILAKARENLLDALSHQDYPFDQLVSDLALERDLSRSPIFDVYVSINDKKEPQLLLSELNVEAIPQVNNTTKYDLSFDFEEQDSGLKINFEYDADLFSAPRMQQMLEDFEQLLTQLLERADQALTNIWSESNFGGNSNLQHEEWYQQQYRDLSRQTLPWDFETTANGQNTSLQSRLDAATHQALQKLADHWQVDYSTLLLATFRTFLYRYNEEKELCIWMLDQAAEANQTSPLLAIKIPAHGQQDLKLLTLDLAQQLQTAREHLEPNTSALVDHLSAAEETNTESIFQILFSTEADIHLVEELNQLELFAQFISKEEGLELQWHYNRERFLPVTIKRMMDQWTCLVQSIAAEPEQELLAFNWLTAREERQIMQVFNDPRTDLPSGMTVVDLFRQQAERLPEKIALADPQATMSYRELNRASDHLATELQAEGVGPGQIVALCIEDSIEMVLAILGVLKAGACYAPIAPDYPAERINYIMSDTQTQLVIIGKKQEPMFADYQDLKAIVLEASHYRDLTADTCSGLPTPDPRDLAYIIYTSGSTGRPKGVMVEHGSLMNVILHFTKEFGYDESEKQVLMANYVFDPSVEQMFTPLTNGAQLFLLHRDQKLDPEFLAEFITENEITHLHATPSLIKTLIPQDYPSLRRICSGAEVCPIALVEAWAPYADFHNKYGPTEATICSITHRYDSSRRYGKNLPIGKPVSNTQTYILDAKQNLQVIGAIGEIYLGGVCLTRGYLNREELTQERFITSPFDPEQKLYRTGDRARYLPDGTIVYLGRGDDQIKIRGFRVELGEIKNVLEQNEAVREAVVLFRSEPSPMILAFVIPEKEIESTELLSYLDGKLPSYMIPGALQILDRFPLNQSAKIDRQALLARPIFENARSKFVAARNTTETQLTQLWHTVLGHRHFGIHQSFFTVGGDSIKVIQLAGMLQKQLGVQIRAKHIFKAPTIAQLAELIDAQNFAAIEVNREQEMANWQKQAYRQAGLPKRWKADWEDCYPMSDIQLGMVYYYREQTTTALYHQQVYFQLAGELNYEKVVEALQLTVTRHPILRTSFLLSEWEIPLQVVHSSVALSEKISREDLRHLDAKQQRQWINEFLDHDQEEGLFDLREAGLFKLKILQLDEQEYGFVWIFHHAILDGWSNASLLTEWGQTYLDLLAGTAPNPDGLQTDYKRFVYEQTLVTRDEELRRFWQKELSDFRAATLPLRRTLSSVAGEELNYDYYSFNIRAREHQALLALGQELGMSSKEIYLSAFSYLLQLVNGNESNSFGLLSNARLAETDGEKVLGCFLNTIPFQSSLSEEVSPSNLLQQITEHYRELRLHDKLSLVQIQKEAPASAGKLAASFDVLFAYFDFHVYENLSTSIQPVIPLVASRGKTNTSFDFMVYKRGGQVNIGIHYANVYQRQEIRQLANLYREILRCFIDRRDDAIPGVALLAASGLSIAASIGEVGKTVETETPASNPHCEPETTLQSQIRDIWAALLQQRQMALGQQEDATESISILDDFFSLGGDSILAMHLSIRLRKALDLDIPVNVIFDYPTIAELATYAETATESVAAIEATEKQAYYAAAPVQGRFYLIHELSPDPRRYNLYGAMQMEGPLDRKLFHQALSILIERQESLRSSFLQVDGEVRLLVQAAEEVEVPLHYRDWTAEEDAEARALQAIQNEGLQAFDLSQAPLFRVDLWKVDTDRHYLFFNMHHIISDEWSMDILAQELQVIYRALHAGTTPDLPALKVHYRDYVQWLNAELTKQDNKLRQFWTGLFADGVPRLDLPLEFPRPFNPSSEGREFKSQLSNRHLTQLEEIAQRENVTPYVFLSAVVSFFLHKLTKQRDIIMGTPVSGRLHPDVEQQIGLFINTMVLYHEVDADASFGELLQLAKQRSLKAQEHQMYPFEELVNALSIKREEGRNPIFDVWMVYQNAEIHEADHGSLTEDLQMSPLDTGLVLNRYDLKFDFVKRSSGLEISFSSSSDLFGASYSEHLADAFSQCLHFFIEHPDACPADFELPERPSEPALPLVAVKSIKRVRKRKTK